MIGAANQLRKAVYDRIKAATGRSDVYTTVAPTGATQFVLCSQFTQQDDSEKGTTSCLCTFLVETVKDYSSGGSFSEVSASGSDIIEALTTGFPIDGFHNLQTNLESANEATDPLPTGLRYRYLIRFNTLISKK